MQHLPGRRLLAQALICPADLKKTGAKRDRRPSSFPEPPGWVSETEGRGTTKYHRSHIIGDRFKGEWVRQNVFTGFRDMNTPNMRRCENRMADSLKRNNPVFYTAKLEYENGRKNIPSGIRMTAENKDGYIFRDIYIPNLPGDRTTC
ncbi:DNA/RNA non-specific endonuclease [Streptomyces albidoflavus]